MTFSIAHGIAFGFISYTGIKLLSGRWRDLTVAVVMLAILFVLKFRTPLEGARPAPLAGR